MRILIIYVLISLLPQSLLGQNNSERKKKVFEEINTLILRAKEIQKTNLAEYENIIYKIDSLSVKYKYQQGKLIYLTLRTHLHIHNGKYNQANEIINEFFKSKAEIKIEYIKEMFYYKTLICYFKNDIAKAKTHAIDYTKKFKNEKPNLISGLLHNLLGAIYFSEDDYNQAVKQCLIASQYFDQINSKRFLLNTYSEIAFIYLQLNNNVLAQKYADLSIEEQELSAMSDPQSLAILKSNAAHIYLHNNQIIKAERLHNEANTIFNTQENIIYKLYNLNREADINFFKKNYYKTIAIAEEIIRNKSENFEIETVANFNLGKSFLKLKKYNEALHHLKIVRKNLEKGNIFEINKEEVLKKITICYEHIGDSINVLKSKVDYLEFKAKKRELLNINQVQKFNEYRNELMITKLEKEKEFKEEKIRNKNLIILINILVAIFLFVMLFILVKNNKKKNILNEKILSKNQEILTKNKKLQETKQHQKKLIKEKTILLKEIHHRVKNNLQLVASLLNLQFNLETKNITEVLEKSQSRIASMALIHENLYKAKNVDKINFNEYCRELISNIKSLYNIDHKTIFESDIEEIEFNIDTIIPLGLILNELITNAFKHAFPNKKSGFITIKIETISPHKFRLIFKDNGIGFNTNEQSNTLGMQLISVLTNQLKGNLNIQSTNKGTTTTIEFCII